MKSIEIRLPQDYDKSFVVFKEVGPYFPCPWHYHPEYELVLVLKSTGRRMVGDNIGYFKEGDLVCMGPLLPHVWVNDSDFVNGNAQCLAEAIVIHFNDDFLSKFLDIPEMEAFKNVLALSFRGMAFKGESKEKINALMKEMVRMNGTQRLSSLFSIFDILSNTHEYELLASPGYTNNIDSQSTDRLKKITEYILANSSRDLALPEVANVANMAVTTFCNFFKEKYRTTFVDYLNTVRIGHACKLLSEKDLNIIEISYECGFNNLANFNRQFKKHKGMTPTEFRKTLIIPGCVNNKDALKLYE